MPCARHAIVIRGLVCAAVLAVILWTSPGRTQLAVVLELDAPITAREAFTTQYGQALIEELARALARAAEPSCPGNAGATAEAWKGHAERLYVSLGQAYLDRMRGLVDRGRLEAAFHRLGGPDGYGELRRLHNDPAIAALGEPTRIRQSLELIDETTGLFDRYVLLSQYPIEPISPLITGSEPLLRLYEEADEAALDRFEELIRTNDTPAIRRYLELMDVAAGALMNAVDSMQVGALGSRDWLAWLDRDLQSLCIVAR